MFRRLGYFWTTVLYIVVHFPPFYLITVKEMFFGPRSLWAYSALKGRTRLFSWGASVKKGQHNCELQCHESVKRANLFLRGVRKGTFSRDKEIWMQWNYQEAGETSYRILYTVVASFLKDQFKGNEGCWVDQEREKSVFLTLTTRKARIMWAYEYSL